jgi:2,3-bisphosphoglycerate-dependent phosphoglycerate mutase
MPRSLVLLALVVAPCAAFLPALPRARAGRPAIAMAAEPHARVVFVRHGQSDWNCKNLFTGWADPELTTLGRNEAAMGAVEMWKEGLSIDVAYTSELTRAQQTLAIVLSIINQEDVATHRSWRLNERMYGALTGLDKKETVEKYGADQVAEWRRSYDTPPPPVEAASEHNPATDNTYAHVPTEDLPQSECLKDCVARTMPYWDAAIAPALAKGKTVLVAAHGNSIRGMVKMLDGISDADIAGLEIPTGIPLVYALDANLRPIKDARASGLLSGAFLGDPAEIAAAQEKVAAQTKV